MKCALLQMQEARENKSWEISVVHLKRHCGWLRTTDLRARTQLVDTSLLSLHQHTCIKPLFLLCM